MLSCRLASAAVLTINNRRKQSNAIDVTGRVCVACPPGTAWLTLGTRMQTIPASPVPWKPTREQIAAAVDAKIPDVIAPELRILFCGINPGLYSAAVGHHFGRPGNRFWPLL